MRSASNIRIAIFVFVLVCLSASCVWAAAPAPSQQNAKREAEVKEFVIEPNHEGIVAKAKKEGKVRVLSSLEPRVFSPMIASFKKKYPFIEAEMTEITGTEAAQRFLLDVKGGGNPDADLIHVSSDFYEEWRPFGKKFDILGMAQNGVLSVPPKMVDPQNRNIVGLGHVLFVAAYNRNLITADKVPGTWAEFLKPELKERKFVVDIRPQLYAVFASCPDQGLGEEWMASYADKIRAQNPVWLRGHMLALTSMIAGEYALHSGAYYSNYLRAQEKDPQKVLEYKVIEPAPVSIMEPEMVLGSARHPYAALLFLEHEASPEGQAIIDKYEPSKASIHSPGSAVAKAIEGKKVCLMSYESYLQTSKRMEMALKAFGFPRSEKK